MQFCHFLASLYPQVFTKFGPFILIFNKMVLIFLRVVIVFTVSSFEYHQVRLPWLHRQWWVAPIHSTSIHWPLDYQVWGNTGVLSQAVTEAKNSSQV